VQSVLQQLSLVWGIKPFHLSTYNHLNMAISKSIEILKEKKLLKIGDCVIYVGSTPLNDHGSTNKLKVSYI